jgi:gamma-glutamyltranspeptidase/glutathione hydrolase
MLFKRILVAALLCLIVPARADTVAPHYMVAAANPLAAQAGLEVLKAHGSAVDAAIATQLVLNLVEPESSGIGGGAFMLLYDPKSGVTTSFDGREVAPASARPDMFLGTDGMPRSKVAAIPGGLSVGIPGVIAMLDLAHQKYGRLPWARLFEPAIRIAEHGFPVGKKLARSLAEARDLNRMPDLRRMFFHADGTPLAEGEILKNPELAKTFRKIARQGARAFYTGPVAQSIVDKVQHAPNNQGGMSMADLAGFHAQERAPVCGSYRVYYLCSMGPPSSGGIAIVQMLGMLERFPVAQLAPNSLSETHLFTQASRLAYADRAKYLGDTAFVDVPVAGLLDRNYIASRSALIDPGHDMGTAPAGNPPQKHADYAPQISPSRYGTSHMTIVDENGQVVSMTTSVESGFGAKIAASGFILNNTLTDFSFQPVLNGKPVANAPAPGKRPLSAMSPTIVFDKDHHFLLGLGSPGGPSIIDYVAQTLIAILDGGKSPAEAVALPRHLNTNGVTSLEAGPGTEALALQLTGMGHAVRATAGEASGLHVVMRVKGGYVGAADPRRDGIAIGQ